MGLVREVQGCLGLAVLAAVVLGGLGSAASPPENAAPFAHLEMAAGSSATDALDLGGHFRAPPGETLSYAVVSLSVTPGPEALVDVMIHGSSMGLVAPATDRTGSQEFQVTACAGAGAAAACTAGNPFTVQVVPPRFAGVTADPAGYAVVAQGGLEGLRPGATLVLHLEVPAGTSVIGDVAWYLDGARMGEGPAQAFAVAEAGPHTVEAWLMTADGPVKVSRAFEAAALPPGAADAQASWIPFGFGLIALVAMTVAASRARLRKPLLLFLVGGLYPRLNPETLLDHFTRGALYQLIKEKPGIHFSELRRRAAISHGCAMHHLRVLEKAGYVQVKATGAYTRFYTTDRALEAESYGFSDFERAVFAAVEGKPGVSQAELALTLTRSGATVSRAVARLVSLGYITARRSKRRSVLHVRPGARLPAKVEGQGPRG